MITFMDPKEKTEEEDKCLDSQLWHACAGNMVQMPSRNSKVFYFPQGHLEHVGGAIDFRNFPKIPAYVPCRVSNVKFMADPESDEVYAKIGLIPISTGEPDFEGDGVEGMMIGCENQEKPASFAKTLTQSDANNGGGFSVPRYCAETIFPRLDYATDPPVQTILAKDVHGEVWKFRHIYRGTPRRHLLTTGWSTFVNHKKLVAGDSIVFLRAENGDLCVGIRRAKRRVESPAGNFAAPHGGLSGLLREDENRLQKSCCKGRLRDESVAAAAMAAKKEAFEVVYYPRASTPEFCVRSPLVRAALRIRWCSGMRFKMAFETEDCSRISWFMGTISSVHVADPIRWPDSPWRLLQVTWDEPDLLQNVNRVSPWLVELVPNVPAVCLSPFSPPRKKLRLPSHPDFLLNAQLPSPNFPGSLFGQAAPFSCLTETTPAGMQGARHARYSLPSSNFNLGKLQPALFTSGFPARAASSPIAHNSTGDDDVSCVLTMGNYSRTSKKSDNVKAPQFLLFGQPIVAEQQASLSDAISPVPTGNSSSEGNPEKVANPEQSPSCEGFQWYNDKCREIVEPNLEIGHCKVFMESEDVGRTLDLSSLRSYEELYAMLANMFGLENFEALNHVLYRDLTGDVKHVGDEPFSDFRRTARRLTILMESSSDNVGMLRVK